MVRIVSLTRPLDYEHILYHIADGVIVCLRRFNQHKKQGPNPVRRANNRRYKMKTAIHIPTVVLTALFSFALAGMADAQILSNPIFDPYSDANLYIVAEGNWSQAESEAQSLGGNLITIQSQAENTFVVNNVLQDFTSSGGPNLSNLPLWIGMYDPTGAQNYDGPGGPGTQHAADFVWVNGSTSTYRNWNTGTGEPNNAGGIEYWTAINWQFSAGSGNGNYGPAGAWNDVPANGTGDGTSGYGGNTGGPYYGIAEVAVPEASSWTLLSGGMLVLVSTVHKRRARPTK
jgi:hypothetical protein